MIHLERLCFPYHCRLDIFHKIFELKFYACKEMIEFFLVPLLPWEPWLSKNPEKLLFFFSLISFSNQIFLKTRELISLKKFPKKIPHRSRLNNWENQLNSSYIQVLMIQKIQTTPLFRFVSVIRFTVSRNYRFRLFYLGINPELLTFHNIFERNLGDFILRIWNLCKESSKK